jgi:NADPH-dependent 7-cyano-7-deazaguanine reductase QueF-like protein
MCILFKKKTLSTESFKTLCLIKDTEAFKSYEETLLDEISRQIDEEIELKIKNK